jgi:hypothetical protein
MTDARARPYWRRVAVIVLAGACYVGGGTQALVGLLHRSPWDWGQMATSASSWAVGMFLVAALLRLAAFKSARQGGDRAADRAIKAGALPATAQPDDWIARLTHRVRDLRQSRRILTVMLVLVAALVGIAAVVNDNDWPVWTLAVGLAAFAVVPFHWHSRQINRGSRLIDTLRGAESVG